LTHALVNNAGINSYLYCVTTGGGGDDDDQRRLDPLFQSNFLGHYVPAGGRTHAPSPDGFPDESGSGRSEAACVVNVSSVMHHFGGGRNFDVTSADAWKRAALLAEDDNNAEQSSHAYARSKFAAVLLTGALNRRYHGGGDESSRKRSRSMIKTIAEP